MKLLQAILSLSGEIKEVKALIHLLKQYQTDRLKLNWVDGAQVMQMLNISKRTLQQWRNAGILPYSRIQGKLYYKVSDLESLLENHRSSTEK